MATEKTPYDAIKRLINKASIPTWLNDYDGLRLASYQCYEDIYWNEPDTFKLTQRGTNDNPLYIPSGRIIVNTMDRYAGKGWKPVLDTAYGSDNEQKAIMLAFQNLFAREAFDKTFEVAKLFGLMRGDWVFYITADPFKPEGSRISLQSLHPEFFFPIHETGNINKILGVDIVEQTTRGEDDAIKRTRYLKPSHPDHPQTGDPLAPISFQVDLLDPEGWEDPAEVKILENVLPLVLMPPDITQLPVYHIKNFEEEGNPFGSSEMRGIERLMGGINQSITDEELALALDGLGMYKSEKGQPRDPVTGNPTNWILGPGRVVHDESFARVAGVDKVTPMLEHIEYIEDRMHEVNGASDVARGKVDVSVAESGIALALRMAPILESSGKKDRGIGATMNQFLFDLRMWFKAYEGLDFTNVRVVSHFPDKLPKDVETEFDRLLKMVTSDPPLITMAYFRDACRELGVQIPTEVNGLAIAKERGEYQMALDEFGGRLNEEIDNAQDPEAVAADTEV